MSSYINNYGQTAGPIRVEGTWLKGNSDYLSFTSDYNSTTYKLLKAGSPNFGPEDITPDRGSYVATVSWVKNYYENNNQVPSSTIDFSEYVSVDAFNPLVNRVEALERSNASIETMQNDINVLRREVTNLNGNYNSLIISYNKLATNPFLDKETVLKSYFCDEV